MNEVMVYLQSAAPAWGPALSLLGILWSFRSPHHRPAPVTKEELQQVANGLDMTAVAADVAKNLETDCNFKLAQGVTLTVTGNLRSEW